MIDFEEQVPKEAIQPHPKHKYPKIVQVISKLPSVIKSPSDLQTCMSIYDFSRSSLFVGLSTLPLAAVSAVLTALDADKDDAQVGPGGAKALDAAGYESVGHLSFMVRKKLIVGRRRRARSSNCGRCCRMGLEV
jgi:hypothetical protein